LKKSYVTFTLSSFKSLNLQGYAQAAFDSKQRNQRHQAMATMLEIADEDLKELKEQIRRFKNEWKN